MLNGIITPLSARPSFDFLRISVILFKMPLSEWNKSGSDLRFWGLCTIIIIIIIYQHHTLWSGVIWGNSKVRSSRPQMMAGIKVTGLWMAAQSLREFTPVWYFLHLKKGSVWFQNATVVTEFLFGSLGLWRFDNSISNALCNGWSRNEREFHKSSGCQLFVALLHQFHRRLWVICPQNYRSELFYIFSTPP